MSKEKTFQVPVWFNVQAEDVETAWKKVSEFVSQSEPPFEFSTEEPVEVEE